ncbi:MAG: hypothetical protein ACOX6I_04860 [Syntrophomonadaceae bacterium]|jgi:hypothetical protein
MARINQLLLVLTVIILVVLGLNTSNQGIGSLTAETRKPVIGLNHDNGFIKLTWTEKTYELGRDELSSHPTVGTILDKVRQGYYYLCRIWRIFYAVFIY